MNALATRKITICNNNDWTAFDIWTEIFIKYPRRTVNYNRK